MISLLPPGKLAVVQDTAPPDRDNAARFSAEDSFDAHVVVDFSVAQIEKCGVFCSENHYLYFVCSESSIIDVKEYLSDFTFTSTLPSSCIRAAAMGVILFQPLLLGNFKCKYID